MITNKPVESPVRLTVPGPRSVPILGPAGNTIRFLRDKIGYVGMLFKTYGHVASLVAGGGTNIYSPLPDCPGTVVVYGPDLLRKVIMQPDLYFSYPLTRTLHARWDSSARTRPLKYLLAGLFGYNSDEHLQQRRLLQPAFHKKCLEAYYQEMVNITRSSLESWHPGEVRNVTEDLRLLIMNIVAKTLFGEDIHAYGDDIGKLHREVFSLLKSPLTSLLPVDFPGFPYYRFLSLVGQVDGYMRALIAQKRAAVKYGSDILSRLMEAQDEKSGHRLSEDELLGHLSTFFAAGYETSTSALTWTLFLLAQHPQIAADLLDEVEYVLHGEAPTIEQLQYMPLLDRIVKESLRVLPPIPFTARVVVQSTELGGYALPVGTEIYLSIYHTHHIPELYPQPELFNPGRWETIAPNALEYGPFSSGRRTCIGASFATMDIKIILSMLIQRYRLQCLPHTRVDRSGVIVLTPRGGLPVLVHKQDRQFTRGVGGIRGSIREMVQLPA
jgi:cytochrome P450